MIHRHRLLLSLGLCWVLSELAFGQGVIPNNLKTAATVDKATEQLITAYIDDGVKKLLDSAPDAVKSGRESLIEGIRVPMGANPSPAYAAKYAEVLNARLCEVLGKVTEMPKDLPNCLNVAVAAARVAEIAKSTGLEQTALKLLDTKQPPVIQLWGVKTAKSVVPELAKIGKHKALLDAVLAAAARHPSGAMVDEAYQAMTGTKDRKAVAVLADPLLELARTRLVLYVQGMPDDPEADRRPAMYLLDPVAFKGGLTAKQKLDAMQYVCDLLTRAAQRGDEPAGIKSRESIASGVNQVLQSVAVLAREMGWSSLAASAETGFKSVKNPAAKLTDIVKPIVGEVKKINEFQNIKVGAIPPITASAE